MKTNNRINLFNNLPQNVKLDDLAQASTVQIEKSDLVLMFVVH
jgi:hypothetical protein